MKDAARQSYQQTLVKLALRGVTVCKFTIPNVVSVPDALPLHQFVDDYLLRYHYKMFPVSHEGRLTGCILMSDLKKYPKEEWGMHSVGELTHPCDAENTVKPDTDAGDAMRLMNRTGSTRLLVVENGELLGVVTLKDLLWLVSTRLNLEDQLREAA